MNDDTHPAQAGQPLEACIHCQSKAHIIHNRNIGYKPGCTAYCIVVTKWFATESEAIEWWNDAYSRERAAAQQRIDQLEAQLSEAIQAMQMAYRKHHLEDESIGWNELSNTLLDTLSNTMGVEELVKWQEANDDADASG